MCRKRPFTTYADPGLLQPGANTLAVFTVEERADGTVALAEAYAGDGERRVLNLILDTTVALLGATAAGFHGLEHTEARAFRWTTGEARINVPITRKGMVSVIISFTRSVSCHAMAPNRSLNSLKMLESRSSSSFGSGTWPPPRGGTGSISAFSSGSRICCHLKHRRPGDRPASRHLAGGP